MLGSSFMTNCPFLLRHSMSPISKDTGKVSPHCKATGALSRAAALLATRPMTRVKSRYDLVGDELSLIMEERDYIQMSCKS